ncbi:MAG: site-specific integrase [Alphaproteobacteria bacterium]|nr:site-specific integrase [Alphaproteobacteria bacterium]
MAKSMRKKKGNGEGTVYKTKSGYRGQIVVGTDDDGKPIRRNVTGKTIREVNEKLTTIKNSIITGTYIPPNKITICELIGIMIEDELKMNYIKKSTYYRKIELLKRFEKNSYLNNTPIQELSYAPLKEFIISEGKMSQSIINKMYMILQKALREAVKRRIISENPIDELKKPKTSQTREKVRALTVEEQQKLYRVLTTEDINYSHQMLLSMLTGMRMGEINALKPEDIDLLAKAIAVYKTMSRGLKGETFVSNSAKTANGNRLVPFSAIVLPLIHEILLCAGKDYLFENKGKIINTSQVNMQFQRVLQKYDIIDKRIKGRVTLHSLRHTFATRCIEAGMQPKVLQHILGHSDIKVTLNTYCDAFENFQNENLAKTDEYLSNLGIHFENSGLIKAAG